VDQSACSLIYIIHLSLTLRGKLHMRDTPALLDLFSFRAPDGQSLMLASSDGYCSIVIFDEFLPLHHTQQHNIQLQAIASSVSTPQHSHHTLPWTGPEPGASLKRNEPSADEEPPIPMPPLISVTPDPETSSSRNHAADGKQPKKKKRRIQPTHIGALD